MASTPRQFKDAVYGQLARIGKSLASGPRLELLDILCQGPRTVEELARQAGQSLANTSHHLQVLRRSRLVEAHKHGVHVTYRLADETICEFLVAFRRLAESRLLEIEQVTRDFLEDRGALQPMGRDELAERVRSGEVTVLDVRPPEEFEAGHIPGALSVPLEELDQCMAELPREHDVVAYCRGPYCVLAIEAVERLRQHGYRAIRFEEGIPDWRARGLPVETSTQETSS